MKRLVIAIDCDDVLLTTAPHLVNFYNNTYGTTLELRHMYNPVEIAAWGTDAEDVAITRIHEFLRTEEHAAIAPNPEAIAAVKELAKQHELHLVTGRADFLEPVTQRMLDRYFPGCFRTVEHTNYLNLSTDNVLRRSKGEVCRAIGADILIDDHVKHGESALGRVEKVLIFGDYPWNQRKVLPAGMFRCINWNAVMEEVGKSAADR